MAIVRKMPFFTSQDYKTFKTYKISSIFNNLYEKD